MGKLLHLTDLALKRDFSCFHFIRHLDKHNRLTGLNIEKDRIELWEESKDGSGKLDISLYSD